MKFLIFKGCPLSSNFIFFILSQSFSFSFPLFHSLSFILSHSFILSLFNSLSLLYFLNTSFSLFHFSSLYSFPSLFIFLSLNLSLKAIFFSISQTQCTLRWNFVWKIFCIYLCVCCVLARSSMWVCKALSLNLSKFQCQVGKVIHTHTLTNSHTQIY